MKIAQIIPSFNVGGGELLAVRLCAEILRQQPTFEVYLVSLYDPTPSLVYDEALASGAKIVTLGKKKGFDPQTPLRMFRALRSIKPDVIHTHLAGLRYAIPAALFLKNSVKVHTVHNMAEHETSGAMQHIHKFAFKILGWQQVALSSKVKQSIHDVYGIDAPVVMNGIKVNNNFKKIAKQEIRDICGLPDSNRIIITIGRLCEQKNQTLLLEAFNILSLKCECTLLIVGEDAMGGTYQKALQNKIQSLPEVIRKNVYLLGPRKDVAELLRASDVFVLSSDWEGVPLTLLEAMGFGVPVVCTSVGGIPDVIYHGKEGLLVPKGDKNALAQAILDILQNEERASCLAKKAREKFERFYSIEGTANGYFKMYQGYLTEG
jgi:glycosyltransferase involved in cell wall biosynthesis